ncbi:putative integral membrane protein [Theileria parva strain Muguga]|uniref:Uncharacterized protein n=1 Tax=Theileria parva TaxID=5875 RepID=Q4N9H0_THEPA|nr:putative integral membrane protein [Theileria parva strain Muguga]EAN33388.1 putative integral membrane protein [Theileria parva strain Muguga]|eukprot:XP_765671.1 hypothetical protein [Theileria parva strain Muguga]
MRNLRKSLLLILLSFSILIQNYKPVSGLLCLGTTALSTICLAPLMWRGMKQIGYFFGSVGYLFQVKCGNYKKYCTTDDIVAGKYVKLDLASKEHGRFITVTDLDDDKTNMRTKIKLYEVKSTEKEDYSKYTIGCVNFYCRKLQCDLKYTYRTVLTYVDEKNRKCIQIESFNQDGNRIMRRIFRERSCAWWYDRILNEKETFLKSFINFNWSKFNQDKTIFKLNIYLLSLPPFISRVRFSKGYYYYLKAENGKITNLSEVIFSDTPFTISKGFNDLIVWHYCTETDGKINTSYVVICQLIGTGWTCSYNKCISQDRKEFKSYESFGIPFDQNVSIGTPGSDSPPVSSRNYNKFRLNFDLHNKNVPDNIDKLSLHLYTQSDHYTLRPRELNTTNLMEYVQIHHAKGNTILKHEPIDSFQLLSVKKYGDEYFLSFSALGYETIGFHTINMEKPNSTKSEYNDTIEWFYETNTRSFMENFLSPHYMIFSFLKDNQSSGEGSNEEKYPNLEFMELDLKQLDKGHILVAKYNDHVTVYSSLYSKYNVFKKLKLDSQTLDIPFDFNSQVFYCEGQNSKFVVISHINKDLTIFKQKASHEFEITPTNKMGEDISNVNLIEVLNLNINNEWINLTLNLNDSYVSDDIEVLIPSYNVVVFKTQYGKRIEKVLTKNKIFEIKSGWPLVSKIMYMEHTFLLIDTVLKNEIRRELYKINHKNDEVLLMSNAKIEYSINELNLESMAKKLYDSLHDLYPNTLPVKMNFDYPKIDVCEFDVDNMTVYYSDNDLILNPGELTAYDNDYKVLTKHKWMQIFRLKDQNNDYLYKIFMLSHKGIYSFYCHKDDSGYKEFRRDNYEDSSESSQTPEIPLLIESVYLPGISVTKTKVGANIIKIYKSSTKVLNPIIFGRHEIKLIGSFSKVDVTRSINGNLVSISIEAMFSDNKKGTLIFTQISPNSDEYKLAEDPKIPFIDNSVDMFERTMNQSEQEVLDFNEGKYPLDLRYMILNDDYYYFTGYTRSKKFEIKFGEQTHTINCQKTRYHIWVRYPYSNVKTCVFLMTYKSAGSLKTVSQKHDNSDSTYEIKRPGVRINWGILSNLESSVVNRNLLSMIGYIEEIFPIDLVIDGTGIDSSILKLEIDKNTTVYTTISKSKRVINNVKYKTVIIKGVPKQLAKQVFVSKNESELLIVIATKTVNKSLVKAYKLMSDTFEMLDLKDIDYKSHKGLEIFKK